MLNSIPRCNRSCCRAWRGCFALLSVSWILRRPWPRPVGYPGLGARYRRLLEFYSKKVAQDPAALFFVGELPLGFDAVSCGDELHLRDGDSPVRRGETAHGFAREGRLRRGLMVIAHAREL